MVEISQNAAPRKWRPTLGLVIVAILFSVLLLPLVSLFFFRVYENHLIRQTESELIAQSAVYASVVSANVRENPGILPLGVEAPEFMRDSKNLHPVAPGLDIAKGEILPPRPDGREIACGKNIPILGQSPPLRGRCHMVTEGGEICPQPQGPQLKQRLHPPLAASRPSPPQGGRLNKGNDICDGLAPGEAQKALGRRLSALVNESMKTTLAGIRILDARGRVVAGGAEIGLSLKHVKEITRALKGVYASAIRQRISDQPQPALQSISRGGYIRVFTALPVVVDGRVAGVVYGSRVPKDVLKALYQQRYRLALAAIIMLAATSLFGWVLTRTITGPIRALIRRTTEIGTGNRDAQRPLKRHGTRELQQLSDSFLGMSEKLFERADYINTFAAHVSHELKSPLTSTRGAVELLLDEGGEMSERQRRKFLENIMADTERLTRLVERLRSLAMADNPPVAGVTTLNAIAEAMRRRFAELEIVVDGKKLDAPIAISAENSSIVFSNLIDNAKRHGADRIEITQTIRDGRFRISVKDDGSGISAGNAKKIFQLFFTTRRDSGGTGMGLSLVQALLKAHHGSIEYVPGEPEQKGAHFRIILPAG